MPDWPSPQEWVVILYIFTSAIEKIREVCEVHIYNYLTASYFANDQPDDILHFVPLLHLFFSDVHV